MQKKTTLLAVLAATAIVTMDTAFVAAQTQTPPAMRQGQTKANKDFAKLSADGSRAYQDIVMTRLAIFDGRIDDAKKFVGEADQDFSKSKNDEAAFTKAEADLKAPTNGAPSDKTDAADTKTSDMKTPKTWLPVDGEIGFDEDFAASPAKAAAVADANKSVANGDRKGAMEKLKLADLNVDVVIAVVPLEQTINDVHQADTMIQNGKFYEASQLLRKVQDSARFDVADINDVPKSAAKTDAPKTGAKIDGSPTTQPATH